MSAIYIPATRNDDVDDDMKKGGAGQALYTYILHTVNCIFIEHAFLNFGRSLARAK